MQVTNPTKGIVRPFKYYIHDAISACCLQLIGNFTGTEIPELSGCWRTAKTTLGNRALIVDVHGLTFSDAQARQWLASMVAEGAQLKPEGYLDGVPETTPESNRRKSAGTLSRLLSSTPTP